MDRLLVLTVDLGWLEGLETWVVDFSPSSYETPPWNALDCSRDTVWKPPAIPTRVPNKKYWIIVDMQEPHRVYQIRIVQIANGLHDIKDFVLEMSSVDPYVWEVVESSDAVLVGTSKPQHFGDFNVTSQYWRITMTSFTGWPVRIRDFCFFGHKEPIKIVPCETLHAACTLPMEANGTAPGYEPPGEQPCHVTVDIHEGIRSVDNPLQVHRSGNVTINPLVSFECGIAYSASAMWTVRANMTALTYPIEAYWDYLPDRDDVFPDKLKLELPWKTMPLGILMVQITVTMNVTELGHVSIGVAQTWMEVVPLPLVAMLTPGFAARSMSARDFDVRAFDSYGPDELVPTDQFSYNCCQENCNPGDFIAYRTLHLKCSFDGNNFWTLEEAPSDFPGIDWTNNITAMGSLKLKVRPDVFTVRGIYTIRVSNFKNNNYARIAEYRFQVIGNPIPMSFLQGNSTDIPPNVCSVFPPEGVSLVDKFCIVCEDFYDELGPLRADIRYEFIPDGVELATTKFPGSGPATTVHIILRVFSGWVLYTPMVDIPPGLIIIELMVSSVDGRNTTVFLDPILIATPTKAQASEYMDGFYDSSIGPFFKLLSMRSPAEAFIGSVISSGVAAALANKGEDTSEIADKVAENMAAVELEDYDGIVGLSTSTLLVTAFPDFVPGDAQVFSSMSLKSAFEKTRELSENNSMPVDEVNRATALIFTGAVNVFKASEVMAEAEQDGGTTSSNNLEANKEATTRNFEALDLLDDIYLENMMPGYDEDELFADVYMSSMHVRIKREDPSDGSEKLYTVGGQSDSFVRVPSFSSLLPDGCPDGEVGVQFLESNFNPFEYSNNSRIIRSDVTGLAVKCGNMTIPVSGLDEPLDILTRRENKSLDDLMYIFSTSAPLGNISVFQFFAKKNMSSMSFSVDFNSTLFPQDVTLWLSKYEPPTPDTYDWTATLPVPEDQLYTIPWINETSLVSSSYQWLLSEEEVDITDFDVDNKTKYHIGVQFGTDLDLGSGEIVNFTLYAFETACVYFEENGTHLWQNDGCRVGLMSNITHIHCRCDHLTKFAGFVAPNPLNIQDVLKANILENPIGLILVLTVFSGYLVGILWARKTDRQDIAKAGVALLPGHKLNPRRECQYVITVYTGFRGNAGTTAEITLVLYGIHYESAPLTLRDDNRVLYQQGSVDSFLVSTEQPLGVLTHMRVWHNNTGYSPSWYLGQIVVVNRGTNKTTYFLSNRWLAVDEGDGKIERLIPTAGEEEMTKFRNVFFAKSSRDMNDGHLWFSVKGRPARSPFTRVQRLSCCLTLLYSTMITNIMFFGRGDDFDPPEPLRIAGLEIDPPITLPQLMIGIQSAVIILPVNLLIVFLFRNSGARAPKKSSSKKVDSEPDRRFLKLLQRKPRSKKTFTSNNPDTPSFWYAREKSVVDNSTDQKLGVLQSTLDHDVEEGSSKKRDEDNDGPKKSSLPWWAVFIGWLLVWSASFVAAFFTVLYTLSFGKAKAEAWVFTFVTSFVTDLFLVQPFKLLLVAMVFALLVKKPVEDEDPAPTPTGDDEEYIYNDTQGEPPKQKKVWISATGWMRYIGTDRSAAYGTNSKSADDGRSTLPPDESVLAEARAKSAEKRKRRAAVLEVIVFGLFVTVIMLTAYQEQSPLAFYMTQNVKGQIVEGDFSDINDIPSFWSWIEGDLIPTTRTAEWYNGQANPDDNVLQDMLTYPLDAVQLRQVRLKPGQHCETPEKMQEFAPRCTVGHSALTSDTDDYTQGWILYNDTINSTDTVICSPTVPPLTSTVSTPVTGANCTVFLTREETDTPWMYKFASLIGSFPYFGQHGTYLTGGYSTPLGKTRTAGLRLATFLKEHNWLDERTRAVFVEIILYNPHANLFSVVTLVVEFTNLGAAYRGAEVVTLRLIQQDAILLFALRAVLAVFILFFALKEAKSLFSRPIEYLSDFWSWVELLVIAIGFSSLGVYFNAQSIIDQAVEQRQTSESVFEIYKSAVNWFQIYTYLLAFLICCATLKFIRLLRFNSHVYALSVTIKKSAKPVLQFFFVAGIILMAFTQMGNLLFGIKLQDYKNILTSLTSLCTMMLGSFDFDALVDGHYILGPLMFFVYQALMQFVLLSMFMTIIMDVYAEESQDPNTDDLQMLAFVKDSTSETVDKAKHTLSEVRKRKPTKTSKKEAPDPKHLNKFAVVLEELSELNEHKA
ncbi:PKD1L3 [Branchiostoma lanceolatum]|uniref:PKD1L3 protein n=1 Tax=Branchiostoma lanceolatum TaxID=7740 RepID=A0A8J9YR22_BRALA|nr:PKD1L3 [Branchiostoma lanceolatum]